MLVQTVGGTRRRVFVSFDATRDRPFRDFFERQGAKSDATWLVKGSSVPYIEGDPNWVPTTMNRMSQCEVLVVLLTATTFKSPTVLAEVRLAKQLGLNICQIIPYGAGSPHVIPGAGAVIRWDWNNVKKGIVALAPVRAGAKVGHV